MSGSSGARMTDFSYPTPLLLGWKHSRAASPCWNKSQCTSGHGSTLNILKEMKVLKKNTWKTQKPLFCVAGAAGATLEALLPSPASKVSDCYRKNFEITSVTYTRGFPHGIWQ